MIYTFGTISGIRILRNLKFLGMGVGNGTTFKRIVAMTQVGDIEI